MGTEDASHFLHTEHQGIKGHFPYDMWIFFQKHEAFCVVGTFPAQFHKSKKTKKI